MRLRLLDRYVLAELLYPFVFGIAAFSSIFIASTMLFKITKYITQYGASMDAVARLFFYSLPEVINYTFPMSMLLAALMAFGKLSGSSEITAMKAGGVSYYRIVAPVLIVGFLVSMFSLVWAEKVVPAAKAKCSEIVDYEIKNSTKPTGETEHIVIKSFKGSNQRITYANSLDEKEGKMTGIAYRVPTSDVSMIDLNIMTKKETTYEEICAKVKEAAEGPMKGIIEYVDDEVVSLDFVGDPHTSIFDAREGIQLNNKFFKFLAFYDNEYGYSKKVLELIQHMYSVDHA